MCVSVTALGSRTVPSVGTGILSVCGRLYRFTFNSTVRGTVCMVSSLIHLTLERWVT